MDRDADHDSDVDADRDADQDDDRDAFRLDSDPHAGAYGHAHVDAILVLWGDVADSMRHL